MAVITTPGPVTASPGNTLTLVGTDLVGGAGAKVELLGQGFDGSVTTLIANPIFAVDGKSVSFEIPDGALSGAVRVTATDLTTAAIALRVVSQYVQAAEFIGQGIPLEDLAPGELDVILRDASLYADTWMGLTQGLRILQNVEQHSWRTDSSDRTRRVYPFRRPVRSVDSFIVQISNTQFATFPGTDIVINISQNYIEILSYAVASYTLMGDIQNLGLVANIIKLVTTAGYAMLDYPPALMAAVKIIATELLTRRAIAAAGFSGMSSVKKGNQQQQFIGEAFEIPKPAKELLRPFVFRRLA